MNRNGVVWCWVAMGLALVLVCGCRHPQVSGGTMVEEPARPVIVARHTAVPVVVDGKLDDAAWRNASVYPLMFTAAERKVGTRLQETGYAMLAWDDTHLYAALKCDDSDVVAEGGGDQLSQWKLGDTMELLLKPAAATWYWELHATPAGRKSSIFIPGRGRFWLDSAFDYTCGLSVAADVVGTINHWEDEDKGWSVEMAMPIANLTERGDAFGQGTHWTVLITRVNFSRTLSNKEFSMWPPMPCLDFHLTEHYATLSLVK